MKKWKGFGAVLATVAIVAVGVFVVARWDLRTLDAEARVAAPGSFVELTDGFVHYAWHGPDLGEVVVLVHGFSTPSFVWAGIVEPLTRAGFRVLHYDNYGRGFSDRPHVNNDADLFDRQLVQLLNSQSVEKPVHLVGYSMGGAIATWFAAHHPERVASMGLIAPAGFPVNVPGVASLLAVPVLGDWLMAVSGKSIILDTMSLPENQGRALPDIAEMYKEQMEYEGYLRSLLSTMRHFPMGAMQVEYEAVGAAGIPVLAVWGDQDSTVPPGNAKLVERAIPDARIEMIRGGTHAITYSEPKRVSAALVEFFLHGSRALRHEAAREPTRFHKRPDLFAPVVVEVIFDASLEHVA
ncbi:MAG: alpha/beta fold hydrolase [Myxococcota bacterium]